MSAKKPGKLDSAFNLALVFPRKVSPRRIWALVCNIELVNTKKIRKMDTKERYNELIEYHEEMSKQASLANAINDVLTEFCILIDQNKTTSNSDKAEAALSLVAACERIYAEHCVDTEDKFEYELNYTKEKAFEYYKKMNS